MNKFQMVIFSDVRCAKSLNETKLKFLGPLRPPQVRGMLNQLLLALPRGKSISKRGRVQRLGARSTRSRYGWDIWTRKVHGVIWMRGRGR